MNAAQNSLTVSHALMWQLYGLAKNTGHASLAHRLADLVAASKLPVNSPDESLVPAEMIHQLFGLAKAAGQLSMVEKLTDLAVGARMEASLTTGMEDVPLGLQNSFLPVECVHQSAAGAQSSDQQNSRGLRS